MNSKLRTLRAATATAVAAFALVMVGFAGSTAPAAPIGVLGIQHASAEAAHSKWFHDPLGDVSCCTRDLTNILVSNTDAGTISFDAHFDDTVEGDDDDDLYLLINADPSSATGHSGRKYEIGAHISPYGADAVTFNRVEGGRYRRLSPKGIDVSVVDHQIRITLDRHLLGDTNGFSFAFQLWEVTSYGGANDEPAPNQGVGPWRFPVKIAVARLRPTFSIERPRAGRRFVARLGLRVAGTHSFLASGRVICAASVGGIHLRSLSSAFVSRRAVCLWRLPRGTQSKTFSASVGVAVTPLSRVVRRAVSTVDS